MNALDGWPIGAAWVGGGQILPIIGAGPVGVIHAHSVEIQYKKPPRPRLAEICHWILLSDLKPEQRCGLMQSEVKAASGGIAEALLSAKITPLVSATLVG
jgi:hypothetical protein